MKTVVDLGVPVIAFCLMLVVGLDLGREDFARLRRRRALLAVGLLAPPVLLSLLALLLVAVAAPPHAIEVGLLLVAVCPIGGISTTYSYLAGAAVSLSVTLTALSCLLAPATLPVAAKLIEAASGRELGFRAPLGLLLAQVTLMLALPVALGMSIRRRWPDAVARLRPGLRRASFAAIVLLIGLIAAGDPRRFGDTFVDSALLACAFVVGSYAIGAGVGRLLTRDAGERFTLAVEFATRNLAVAIAIAVTLLGDSAFSIFASTYFLVELPILLAAIALAKRRIAAVAAAA